MSAELSEVVEQGPLQVGEFFLNYEVLAPLGFGGHAWVYRARHRFMGHHVAIKVLNQKSNVIDERARRGLAEAQIEYQIKHPNVVDVIDAGITPDGTIYIVMELLNGRPMRSALEEYGRLDVEEVLGITIQIAQGMQVAHENGIIHRDLKPENVFLVADQRVKIIDFGVAKVLDGTGYQTEKDRIIGTILYMSPEQMQAKPVTPLTDVFSLGVMMYEALAGEHPVRLLLGNQEQSFYEISRIIVTRVPPPVDQVNPRVPRAVAALVNQATAKLMTQRFTSMQHLAQACAECLTSLRAQRGAAVRRDLSRWQTTSSELARVGPEHLPPAAASVSSAPSVPIVALRRSAPPPTPAEMIAVPEAPTHTATAYYTPAPSRRWPLYAFAGVGVVGLAVSAFVLLQRGPQTADVASAPPTTSQVAALPLPPAAPPATAAPVVPTAGLPVVSATSDAVEPLQKPAEPRPKFVAASSTPRKPATRQAKPTEPAAAVEPEPSPSDKMEERLRRVEEDLNRRKKKPALPLSQ